MPRGYKGTLGTGELCGEMIESTFCGAKVNSEYSIYHNYQHHRNNKTNSL